MKLVLILILLSQSAFALTNKLVVEGQGIVWGMDFIDANTMIYTEREGNLKLLDLKTQKVTSVPGAPAVYARGQGGLLDIKLHPNFSENKRVYLSYSKKAKNGAKTALGYGILEGNKLLNFKDIFVAVGNADTRRHYGSRIVFTEKKNIFLSIGERGHRPNAQDLTNHFGKIIRITDEGKALEDNPFFGQKGKQPEIWSYGHRNPQGLFYDLKSKTLYEMEHGPRGGDEINIIKRGANYGWPIVSQGQEYWNPFYVGEAREKQGMESAIKYYVPSIAPCGLVLYQGDRYQNLKGSLLSGALKLTHLNQYNPKTKKETRHFEKQNMRVRNIVVSPDDYVYFSTDGGKIFKVTTH